MKVLLPIVVLLLLGGAESPTPGVCACAVAMEQDGWCDVHELGYLGSVEITSRMVFEALDAHGHDVDHATFDCATCQAAIKSEGFCEEHRVGFVDGQAYFSRLSYHLMRGERRNVSKIDCPVCQKNVESHGWCDEHELGMVGAVAIGSSDEFEQVERALRILHAANAQVERCERCAVAIVTSTRCPVCRILYRDGEAQEEP